MRLNLQEHWTNDHLWQEDDRKGQPFLGVLTKKLISFFKKKRVTPSVTAPGDTNLSDATAHSVNTSVQRGRIVDRHGSKPPSHASVIQVAPTFTKPLAN